VVLDTLPVCSATAVPPGRAGGAAHGALTELLRRVRCGCGVQRPRGGRLGARRGRPPKGGLPAPRRGRRGLPERRAQKETKARRAFRAPLDR
jgi:hypothetical protein